MHRRSGIRAAALLAAATAFGAHAQTLQTQPLPEPGERVDKPAEKATKPPARPRIILKPKGGTGSSIGDDAPGGGAPASPSSKGGTPGTPSGSFTGEGARP